MFQRSVILPALLPAVLLLQGCVIDARERDTLIEPARELDVVLAPERALELRIPAAEVVLRNGPDDRIRGDLRVFCPEPHGRCARKLGDLDFVVDDRGDTVRIALTHDGSWRYRHGSVRIRLSVPAGRAVHLDQTAGEVDAVLDNCLTADVEAGDVDVTLPMGRVASVLLDTGVGDASLSMDGRRIEGARSLLVGAEARWDGGDGDCHVAIDLQAGDLRVDLDGSEDRRRHRLADVETE